MTDDPRAEPPEQPKTAQIAAVPPWAVELTLAMKSGIAEVRADISLVSNDLSLVKDRVTILETERTKLSGGVRGLSSADSAHDAQLAQERAAREALADKVDNLTKTQETQLAILGRLDKVASNPLVKTLLTVLGTALATWAASKGLK
jgi:hypothetical protein